jgi:DNA mismatch repair ATPase MutS
MNDSQKQSGQDRLLTEAREVFRIYHAVKRRYPRHVAFIVVPGDRYLLLYHDAETTAKVCRLHATWLPAQVGKFATVTVPVIDHMHYVAALLWAGHGAVVVDKNDPDAAAETTLAAELPLPTRLRTVCRGIPGGSERMKADRLGRIVAE